MKEVIAYQNSNGVLYTSKEACASSEGLLQCPKCKGSGLVKVIVKEPYPSGLPDSGWVEFTEKETEVGCDVCFGIGYTTPKKREVYKDYEKLTLELSKVTKIMASW